MHSGFLTYRKSKGYYYPLLDDSDCGDSNNSAYISVYQDEVEPWRKLQLVIRMNC